MRLTETNEKFVPTAVGLFFTLLLAFLLYLQVGPANYWLDFLENQASDLQTRHLAKPVSKDTPLGVVYIDDKSLMEQGRWPWSRLKLAELREKLQRLGASVVVFDMTFPDVEKNISEEVLDTLEKDPTVPKEVLEALQQTQGQFDYNSLFAKSLGKGNSVLGMIFTNRETMRGVLPPPSMLFTPKLASELQIRTMKSYIGNIQLLQDAAKHGGFINAFPDPDGLYRFSPLLIRFKDQVYFSLALQAVSLFLASHEIILNIYTYEDTKALEGIQLGKVKIPLTPNGEILIPYRKNLDQLLSISATDVLNDRVSPDTVANKIIFIGFSASGLVDLVATPISPLLEGVAIHAMITAGILDGYLPYKPTWGKGAAIGLVLLLGIFSAIVFPRLGGIAISGITILLILALSFFNWWMWARQGILLFFTAPILTILGIYIVNLLTTYFLGKRHYRMIRQIFSQYVPPAHVNILCQKSFDFVWEGENKELTVLFSDIRNFTTMSEALSAPEVKDLLDRYFTPMTETIFEYQGTIDKYIGDAIMAFWGAPLDDPRAPFHAVTSAFAMQSKLIDLNKALEEQKKPAIKIGIGINTGIMHVGDMGSRFRLSYTVIGDAVNLASRLENLTKTYCVGIIVGENTQERTNNEFLYRKLDRVQVKGKKTFVTIYQPICRMEEATSQIRAELEMHAEAVEFYIQKNYQQARSLFQALTENYPQNQPLYGGYLQRMQSPPLEEHAT